MIFSLGNTIQRLKKKRTPLRFVRAVFCVGLLLANALGSIPVEAQFFPEPAANYFGNTYKPSKTVPKRIFAEALQTFLEIQELPKKEACYKDVKKTEAHAAICALRKAKIFTGSKKIKFYPNAKTTWKFALQNLCQRGTNPPKKKTLSACKTHYAKLGFIPKNVKLDKAPTYLELETFMEKLAEGVFPNGGSVGMQRPTPTEEPPAGLPPSPPPAESGPLNVPARAPALAVASPHPASTISQTFFTNIVLDAPLPNHFYLDEVYFIEGRLNQAADEIFLFLCRDGQGCDSSIDFVEDTTQNGTRFKVGVHFKEAGNFQIGMIPGRSGSSPVSNISVLPEPPAQTGGQVPTGLSAAYRRGKPTFTWNGSNELTRLVIFQNQKRRDYLFRQNTTSYSPSSADFEGFKKGQAGWLVFGNAAATATQELRLGIQDFYKADATAVEIRELNELLTQPGELVFTAKALKKISKKAAVTLPNGTVSEFEIAGSDIAAGNDIRITRNLASTGTYIFEVNDPEGGAVVNVPIYVGNEFPLLPDYFALHPPVLETAPIVSLSQSRQELISLINADRGAHGLSSVSLSEPLNIVAQAHSEDMVSRSFFGHVNPSGQAPDDRRKAANYRASIRENLAKSTSLQAAEQGLMRSPIHRDALLDPSMTRVGLGITKNSEGYVIVTQNFSADPISLGDLPNLGNELFDAANMKRGTLGLDGLAHSNLLRQISQNWSSRMAVENFFGVTDNQGGKLVDYARNQGVNSSMQIHVVKVSEPSLLGEQLSKQSGLSTSSHTQIGVGLSMNDIGELYMTTLYTP